MKKLTRISILILLACVLSILFGFAIAEDSQDVYSAFGFDTEFNGETQDLGRCISIYKNRTVIYPENVTYTNNLQKDADTYEVGVEFVDSGQTVNLTAEVEIEPARIRIYDARDYADDWATDSHRFAYFATDPMLCIGYEPDSGLDPSSYNFSMKAEWYDDAPCEGGAGNYMIHITETDDDPNVVLDDDHITLHFDKFDISASFRTKWIEYDESAYRVDEFIEDCEFSYSYGEYSNDPLDGKNLRLEFSFGGDVSGEWVEEIGEYIIDAGIRLDVENPEKFFNIANVDSKTAVIYDPNNIPVDLTFPTRDLWWRPEGSVPREFLKDRVVLRNENMGLERTLVEGTDYTLSLTDASGEPVEKAELPGAYTLEISFSEEIENNYEIKGETSAQVLCMAYARVECQCAPRIFRASDYTVDDFITGLEIVYNVGEDKGREAVDIELAKEVYDFVLRDSQGEWVDENSVFDAGVYEISLYLKDEHEVCPWYCFLYYDEYTCEILPVTGTATCEYTFKKTYGDGDIDHIRLNRNKINFIYDGPIGDTDCELTTEEIEAVEAYAHEHIYYFGIDSYYRPDAGEDIGTYEVVVINPRWEITGNQNGINVKAEDFDFDLSLEIEPREAWFVLDCPETVRLTKEKEACEFVNSVALEEDNGWWIGVLFPEYDYDVALFDEDGNPVAKANRAGNYTVRVTAKSGSETLRNYKVEPAEATVTAEKVDVNLRFSTRGKVITELPVSLNSLLDYAPELFRHDHVEDIDFDLVNYGEDYTLTLYNEAGEAFSEVTEYGIYTLEITLADKYEQLYNIDGERTRTVKIVSSESNIAIDETNFPDDIFRHYVHGFDTDRDGYLDECERGDVKTIQIDGLTTLASLKGLELFPNLEELSCVNGALTELDVSFLTKLKKLDVSRNMIKSLNVSGCGNLKELYCNSNRLDVLAVGDCPVLEILVCSENWSCDERGVITSGIRALDVSKNTALKKLYCGTNLIAKLDLQNNTALMELSCGKNPLKGLDISANTNLERLICEDNGLAKLDVSKNTELYGLYCSDNALTSLDVAKCTKLEYLECFNNALTSLDVSANTSLKYLDCSNNALTKLDLGGLENLAQLDCGGQAIAVPAEHKDMHTVYEIGKGLEAVDFGACLVAYKPYKGWYDAESGTLTMNGRVTGFSYNYPTGYNGQTMEVTVMPEQELSAEEYFELDKYFPDEEFRACVSTRYDTDHDDKLSETECCAVWAVGVNAHEPAIASLEGIKLFANLESLSCGFNKLEKLDVSGMKLLKDLECYRNDLTEFNITGCEALETIICFYNKIGELDFTGCPKIRTISCHDNALTDLEVGSCTELESIDYTCNRLTKIDLGDLPNLKTVMIGGEQQASVEAEFKDLKTVYQIGEGFEEVDFGEGTYDPKNGTVTFDGKVESFKYEYPTGLSGLMMDVTVTPTKELGDGELLPINEKSFPDETFRNYVKNFDTDKDGYLSDVERLAVKKISINEKGEELTSIEGIKLFPKVTSLQCVKNALAELDVRGMKELESISCWQNAITKLDARDCPKLKTINYYSNNLKEIYADRANITNLYCNSNGLTELDLSGYTGLKTLDCDGNQLKELDLSACAATLDTLECSSNALTELDVSGCTALRLLMCESNEIRELDLSACGNLLGLHCSGNGLEELDISGCTKLQELYCNNNALAKLDIPSGAPIGAYLLCDGQEITLPAKYAGGKTVYTIGTGFRKADFGAGVYDSNAGTVTFAGQTADFNYVYTIDGAGHAMQVHATHEHDAYANPVPATHDEDGTVGAYTCGICEETSGGEVISKGAVFTLPDALATVEAEAFSGLPMQQVTVPEGVETIKAGAFANCASLKLVIFEGDTEIENGAFGKNVVFLCAAGSKPAEYAESNGIKWFDIA